MTLNKICKICNIEKPLFDFYKSDGTKDKRHSYCKSCCSERARLNHIKNYELNLARNRKYYIDNHEKEKEARRDHYRRNKKVYLVNFYKRDARIKQATPSWLSEEMLSEIKQIYKKCETITIESGTVHHVDHIVPINGKTVCGLHVPWNLRIITASENLRKSNKHES
jgi:hypothetical protein